MLTERFRCNLKPLALAMAGLIVAWVSTSARADDYQSLDGNPVDHLPEYIRQVSGFGERPEWSHDGTKILFVEKPFGEVYELDVKTGLVHPVTRHFTHYGFTRANYLANGDLLLCGPAESFDVADRQERNHARDQCTMWVLRRDGKSRPVSLGTLAAEGPAVSRGSMKVAWAHRDRQDERIEKNHAKIFVADLVEQQGRPVLLNPKEVFNSHRLPFKLGNASLETQDFVPSDDRWLTISVYQIDGGHNTDTFLVDTQSGEFRNMTRSPDFYDEPEGVFPDGKTTCVEHAPSLGRPWPLCDLYQLKLDGSGRMRRLTSFSKYKGYKASQGVVSDDGTKLCFQLGKSGDEAGVGYGFFVMDLQTAEPHLEPFLPFAATSEVSHEGEKR